MKKLTFEQLKEGKLYGDSDGVGFYIFCGFRNDYLATFHWCEYDEEQGEAIETQDTYYLTKREIERWREW